MRVEQACDRIERRLQSDPRFAHARFPAHARRRRRVGGGAGNHVLAVPRSRSVVVITGDPGFEPGPPPSDRLPPDWRPGLHLVREELLPLLLA